MSDFTSVVSQNVDREGPLDVYVVNRNGTRIRELPEATVNGMSKVLNGYGTCQLKIPKGSPGANSIELGKNEIQVHYNGSLEWWGVPWRSRRTPTGRTVDCDELMSYLDRRFITFTSLDFDDIDQLTIAWNLISHTQSVADGSFGFTASFSPSGRKRLRRYLREDHENILESLQEFTQLSDGFDIEVRGYQDGLRRFIPHFPRKGTFRSNLVLEWGRNIIDYSFDEDANELANHIYVTGGNANDIKFEENHRDSASAAYYGVMQAVVSEGGQLDVGWLLDRAIREVARRKQPLVLPEVTVKNDPVQLFGVLETGDTVPVVIQDMDLNLNGTFRIEQISWNPNDTLTLQFVEP